MLTGSEQEKDRKKPAREEQRKRRPSSHSTAADRTDRSRRAVQQRQNKQGQKKYSGEHWPERPAGSLRKYLMPLLLLAAVVVTVGIALAARLHSRAVKANTVTDSSAAASTELVLEKNNYPAVNALFRTYYDAMVAGDTDAIGAISAELSDEEKIRIEEISKYIESYPSIDVYTKTGPVENSYVCYVVTTMKFKDHDWEVPGMQTMYVCTNDQGELYINNAHDQTQTVSDYIQMVSLQDDVVDLNNKVTAEYNKLVADDADLSAFLNELSSNIDVSVGQALGQLQAQSASTEAMTAGSIEEAGEALTADEAETDSEETAGNTASGAEESGPAASSENTSAGSSGSSASSGSATILTATDVVNVRNAASESADTIGTTIKGGQYQLVKQDTATGWSEIIFNGTHGFVKSEFFTSSHS